MTDDGFTTEYLGTYEWHTRIQRAQQALVQNPVEIVAVNKLGISNCLPLHCLGENEMDYIVKAAGNGRCLGIELITSRVAQALGCPVPDVDIVSLSQRALKTARFTLTNDVHIPGLAYGSRYIPGVRALGEHEHYPHESENHPRVALLALLFGVTLAHDPQMMLRTQKPQLIYGVDFGLFFCGYGPTTYSVMQSNFRNPPISPDQDVMKWSMIEPQYFLDALEALDLLTDEKIIEAVAEPPEEWGIEPGLRIAIADTLAMRRDGIRTWRPQYGA